MRLIFKLILVAMLVGIVWPAFAQASNESAPIDPDLIARADRGEADALYDLGMAYAGRGGDEDRQKATAYLEQAHEVLTGTGGNSSLNAWTLYQLGTLYATAPGGGDYERAEQALIAALRVALELPDPDIGLRRSSWYNLGWTYFQMGGVQNMARAQAAIQKSLDLYEELTADNYVFYAQTMNLFAETFNATNQFGEAMRFFGHVSEILERTGDRNVEYALARNGIGVALQGLSRYAESLDHFAEARAVYIEFGGPDHPLIANTYLDEGISHEGAGDYEDAIASYREAMGRYEAAGGSGSVGVGAAINNIAWVYRRIEDYDRSLEWFLRAAPIIDRNEGRFSRNAGKVNINIGIVEHYLGNQTAAIRAVMKALPYIKANNEVTLDEQRWAYDTLARAFRARGETDRAIAFAKLAVNAQQAIRTANRQLSDDDVRALADEWRWLYEHLADMLIEEGRFAEAQAVLNMEKEQEVFEFLRRDASADLRQTQALLSDEELGEQEKIVAIAAFPVAAALEYDRLLAKVDNGTASIEDEDRIFILQDSIQIALDEFDAQVDAFLEAAIVPRQEVYRDQLAAVGSYKAMLERFEQRTALVQIAALENATHIFLTLPSLSVHRQSEIGESELSRLAFSALSAIEGRQPDAVDLLGQLYDVLLRPVEDELAGYGVEMVMFNVDGPLRYVPFAALHDGEGYVIERHAVSLYTPSVETEFQRSDRSAESSAGFGVTAAHPGFSPLPGVQRELESVFVGEDDQGILSGPAAFDEEFSQRSLRRALLRNPSVLHIASHFNLVPGREDDSFLLLGDGSHLPLSTIRNNESLRFAGVDLVTLSACQTAVGGGDGSEIEGFGAIAQLSGASSVMASLWPVADEATAQLMGDFYVSMVAEGLSKAEALRSAQLAMLQGKAEGTGSAERAAEPMNRSRAQQNSGFAHPYFWSPFVLMGNWL